MKKSITVCAATLFFTIPAMAATTGQVKITGNVPIACDLEIRQEPGASNITDLSAGHPNLHVATATETCNDPDGYTVTMLGGNSGSHEGKFKDTVSGDEHPFTVTYNSVSVSPGGVVTDSGTVAVNLQKPVHITYPAEPSLTGTVADTYEETLTFTISAK